MWIRLILTLAIAFTFFGCPDTRTPDRDAGTGTSGSGGTVYDDEEGADADDIEEVDTITEDYTGPDYGEEDEAIESTELEIAEPADEDVVAFENWEPVFFGFDRASIPEDVRARLTRYAETLKQRPNITVLIEGHCDSRGTEAYNQALGERRAEAIRRFFAELGVDERQLRTISYGELRPRVEADNEAAWSQNRRVEFTF